MNVIINFRLTYILFKGEHHKFLIFIYLYIFLLFVSILKNESL